MKKYYNIIDKTITRRNNVIVSCDIVEYELSFEGSLVEIRRQLIKYVEGVLIDYQNYYILNIIKDFIAPDWCEHFQYLDDEGDLIDKFIGLE